jgi:SAP domain/IQ calmodulin-binding motif|uniref:SAP domain-containing protein n=1 Tax=viral metagenome TaxID=1070528 RepID=A0A6C0HPT7_9ZZZZ
MVEDEIVGENYIKKNGKVLTLMTIDEYTNKIYSRCEKNLPQTKKLEKISNDNMIMPTYSTCHILFENNYNVQQLKQITKHYKLKVSGNKKELVNRIYIYLKLSEVIIKIQKVFRGHLQRKYEALHGPAFKKRSLCTNDSDFLTGDCFKSMDFSQFFSYKDEDGFIYGFDVISLYNLIIKSGRVVKNPYNRNDISKLVIQNMRNMIRLSRILKIAIDIEIKDDTVSNEKSTELRTLELFQNIDALGNYSDPAWFLTLNRVKLVKFIRELVDIWSYRAQLTNEVKRKICPPTGDPFRGFNLNYINSEESMDNVRKTVISILEKFVNNGVDNDSKSLGAYYVLGALTLVSENAATSLPWLFQSVAHFI